ncbi:MAG: hypothetical protein KQJ78_23095 [Deltaproteobacteria bacterium]|nr:hypothetical protein [Deltaproteobacteria bacterium]
MTTTILCTNNSCPSWGCCRLGILLGDKRHPDAEIFPADPVKGKCPFYEHDPRLHGPKCKEEKCKI